MNLLKHQTPDLIEYTRQIKNKFAYYGMTGHWPTPEHIAEVRARRRRERQNDTRKN